MKRLFFSSSSLSAIAPFLRWAGRVRVLATGGFFLVAMACWAASLARAADKDTVPTVAAETASDERTALREQAERLRIENELLKRENQQLRRLLLNRAGPATNTVVAANASPSPGAGESGLVHWLSTGGKRHNAACRYFQNTTGRLSGPQEGTACKVCGG